MDIKIHTTDELIAELKRRHPDGALIAVQNPPHEIRSSGTGWRMGFAGDPHVTLKLANVCLWHHQQQFMNGVWQS
jgi:hypothetical protein